MIPDLLDRIVELAFDPRVAAFFGVCFGVVYPVGRSPYMFATDGGFLAGTEEGDIRN